MRYCKYNYAQKQILNLLHNRLNLVYNRSICFSPPELHSNQNPLDNSIQLPKDIASIANDKTNSQNTYDMNLQNKSARNLHINFGEFIYMNTPRHKKQDILYDGPFEVIETDNRNNGLKIILHNNKSQWINQRNCFLFRQAEYRSVPYDKQISNQIDKIK